ncbi:MAG: hypothetical protein NVSMB47_00620 [Polyangiales bacterium]
MRRGEGTGHLGGTSLRFAGLDAEYTRPTQLISAATLGALTFTVDDPATAALPEAAPEGLPKELPTQPSPARAGSRVWATLDRVKTTLERVREHVVVGADLRIESLTVGSARGAFGPWGARMLLGPDATSLELLPADSDGRKPLVVRALVPREHGKWSAELQVGPATLSEVGVHEGAFGLVDVAHTTAEARGSIELDPDEKTFAADGTVQVHDASFADPRVADDTVTGLALGLHGVVTSRDDFQVWSLAGGRFELGKLRLDVDGTYEVLPPDAKGKPAYRLGARWTMPTVQCADALGSLPTALIPKLAGKGVAGALSMSGTFGGHGSVGFDTGALDKTQVELFIEQRCVITQAPSSIAVERFRAPFELRTYDPSGKQGAIESFGPGTASWVEYSQISPYVTDALLTSEDGAFFSHNGFSPASIRNAIVANLKAGKFALGASTITMQLVKNVYLDRRKQLSRKVQEAVLTVWLEETMPKPDILELYLNVIEFGPNLYGIGPAAWHYFGRPPSDLDPLEATFLVSILPSPVRRHAMWDAGAVGDGYLGYLRTLLREEHRRGHLDDEELSDALSRPLVFHKPGMPSPEPHVIKKDGGTLQIHDDPTKAKGDFDPVWAPEE